MISPKTWRALIVCFIASLLLSSCKMQSSELQDIYFQDRDGKRRRAATEDERLWTISMGGCTGSLISPEYMITAAHCQPNPGRRFRSGAAINNKIKSADLSVTSLEEINSVMDYAIVRISWSSSAGTYKHLQKYPPLIGTKPSDISTSTRPNQGDRLFTVGFPQDKFLQWGATYAEGEAKKIFYHPQRGPNFLAYNVGIIDGNSGGPVYRISDHMLVSLTNDGPRPLGQPGWDSSDKDRSQDWNFGIGLWEVYARSKILQDIFPGGKNRFAQNNERNNPLLNNNEQVFAAIQNDFNDQNRQFLYFSLPAPVQSLLICADNTKISLCTQSSPKLLSAQFIKTIDNRPIYRLSRSISLAQTPKLQVVMQTTAGNSVSQAFEAQSTSR